MPDVVSDEDLNALAAEFVLGTLDYEERKGATALLEVDHAFRGIVRIWERRLGELHLMVEAVEPDAGIWARIRPQITGIEQVELAIPSHAETSAAAEGVPAADAVAPAAATAATTATDTAAVPEPSSLDAAPSSRAPMADMPETASASTTSEGAAESGEPAAGEAFMAGRSRSLDETELRLTELAALLPVTGQEHSSPPQPSDDSSPPPPVPDLQPVHDQAPELNVPEPQVPEPEPVAREFVPPAPMAARSVTVLEVPVRRVGRGWIAATCAMGLVAIMLAGLIGAWRYFPERLPVQLGVNSVLNLPGPAPAPEPRPDPPPPPPFDE